MDDIEALCNRILLINHGRLLSDGTLDDLRARVTSERWLVIDLANGNGEELVSDAAARVLKHEGNRVTLSFDPREISPADLIARLSSRHAVRDLFVHNPPIEEIIAHLYAEKRT
jgi:ABC-2 type transport system ATP-binding protein